METKRQQKISRLIQQDMGDIFLREMKPVLGNSLITVTGVRITPDLSIARIHVSIMPIGTIPSQDGSEPQPATKQGIIDAILTHASDLRRRLGLREGKQLRIIPQLDFYLDDSLDYIENIENLLRK
ncbi:MAG: ribosome-binding factor A [Bacteroidales bacterium]|nr:ribosome-binding factor A [Bacteroidales bacterium]MBP5645407.1 ribosome-binding factor A [Bacteroidales bacterium]